MRIELNHPHRPDWVRDDDVILVRHYGNERFGTPCKVKDSRIDWLNEWCGALTAFEIADDHPYAIATSRGFKFWPGGPVPPKDIDWGKPVMLRNGIVTYASAICSEWDHEHGEGDIIGYTPKENTMVDLTKPVQTRDGRKARLVDTSEKSDQPIGAWVTYADGTEQLLQFYPTGRFLRDKEHPADLINVPETVTRYVNVYPTELGSQLSTREKADELSALRCRLGVLTVTICGDDVQASFEKG